MTQLPYEITEHYEREIDEGTRITRGPGRIEFWRTQEVIRRHLPDRPLDVLDIGGAAGVHAAWLAEDGHRVRLIDPMPRHVEQASQLASDTRHVIAELGDARQLSVGDQTVDAVLMLGPLYHLVDRDDRVIALREAKRVLRPGGYVFAAAVSRFASLFDGLSRGWMVDAEFREVVANDLRTGQHR